jgi:predicted HTH transcriptional regulator
VRESMAFLERTMPLGARFPEGQIFREDRFPVPLDAFREIVLNAVMHRDYSHYSGYVAIAVFDDRIEIQSYGRLPNGITVEQLSGPHRSKPTNPLIAEAFHRTGAVEIWGRGTNRVIAICKQHGATEPTFEEREGFLIVAFKAQMVAEAFDVSVDMTGKMTGKTLGKAPGKTRDLIIQNISAHPEMTLDKIAASIGKSRSAVERAVAKLVYAGMLERVGSRKYGHWILHIVSDDIKGEELSVQSAASIDTPGKTPGNTPSKTRDLIIQNISAHPEMTLEQIAAAIGKSYSAVERAVAKLVHEGRLKRTGSRKEGYWEAQAISEETTDKVLPDHSTVSEGSLEELADKTTEDISESIIRTIGKNPEMTLTQVASAIGKSLRTVARAAIKLVEEGTLKHIGPSKGGRWIAKSTSGKMERKRRMAHGS